MPSDQIRTLWTIGHSTRTSEEFLALLKSHGIQRLVDVRTVPSSRRNPQFNTTTLARTLAEAGLEYRHLPQLGGRRPARPDSVNRGWRNAGFRGYADYMQTALFGEGLVSLLRLAEEVPTAILCAEAVPWRCHRALIADAAVSRGWAVRHIVSPQEAQPHHLTIFARVEDGRLVYPEPPEARKPGELDPAPCLF
ncbi:DUF488 domain-containing protein [Nitrospira sp. Kam-Ns4a]